MNEKWKVTWDAGANRRPAPNVNNASVPPPLADNAEFDVVGYFIPPGKTEAQEYWGELPDGNWVALTYNSQVRAVRVVEEQPPGVPNEIPVTVTIGANIGSAVYMAEPVTVIARKV